MKNKLFVLWACIAVAGCKGQINFTASPAIEQLTEAQQSSILETAEAYVASVAAGDTDAAWAHWNAEQFWQTSVKGLPISKAERVEAKQPTLDSLKATFMSALSGSRYSLRRAHVVDGQPRFLCRMLNPDGSINYHDYIVSLEDETPRIVDVYVYVTGERLTASLRSTFAAMLAQMRQSPISAILGKSNDGKKNVEALAKIIEHFKAGRFQAAINTFESLPKELQKNKLAYLNYVQSCMALAMNETSSAADNQRYEQALLSYREHFENDPSLALVSIDYWFLSQNWHELVNSIHELDQAVGPDAHNQFYLSYAYRELGDLDQALSHAEKAIQMESDLEESWTALLEVVLLNGDHDRTVETLDRLEGDFGYVFAVEAMEAEPLYAEFLVSEQGQAWVADRQ